jgi:novobiocin biosynthesis protein NovU
MGEAVWRVGRCRVCGLDDWLDVMSFGANPLANGFLDPAETPGEEPEYPLDVAVCRGCWLMSIRQVVDPEALFGHYVYVSSDSDQIRQHMRDIVQGCVRRAGLTAGDLVVEFGSNIGTQLELFKQAGMRSVGVDPARNLARVANERGIETVADFFTPEVADPIARDHGPARLVLGRQCFAHIDDVHNVLKAVDAVLASDGLLAIEVPYLVDLLEENQFDTIYHEHLSYFSVGTLGRLFEAHGLRVLDAERVAVHGGSVVVFAGRAGTEARPSPVVTELLALEEQRGLTTERAYRVFADRSRQAITEIGDLIRGLVADGKRVAAYGAPSKGSALLQACRLGPEEVVFCSDTTPLKHGKLLPGTHIPVWSREQARAHAPDYFLILAWNYADEIIRKERAFLEQGGSFIVPIPQPRIVSAQPSISAGTGPASAMSRK